MASNLSRRSFLKKTVSALAGLTAASVAGYGYARYAEPGWLRVNQVALSLKRLPPAFDRIKIVQFSDVHLGFHYTTDQLAGLVDTIQSHSPDLIVFTGDLYDYAIGSDGPATVRELSRLQAPFGKAAVLGNHDYYGRQTKQVVQVMKDGGFDVLINRSTVLQRGGDRLWLSGVDDMWDGQPDLPAALRGVPADECVLLLSHCPDFADIALQHPVDLQLSGHSHGGQVRLPFYGHIVTPTYGQKYVDGLYVLGDGKLQVYTNRGIGVSVYPVRFCCRPELTVFTLHRG
ncbi:metallophosphoesterase [Paenibacillus doosanensis]|uniref:Metallophosphoesterase n=1 Tax=Paenibacillus konkukensis TaxID=2020716 RepID=A0ABY4RRP0_9BACL|nr:MULTISPECIES: metallophosphoesterase [Paenibacillus]MCS7464559.1 metallophosphoesterase [Paenibacillus doosanensis]UQZ84855.1 putative metallophosphoesterase [Paenibacillus konkukensis]